MKRETFEKLPCPKVYPIQKRHKSINCWATLLLTIRFPFCFIATKAQGNKNAVAWHI